MTSPITYVGLDTAKGASEVAMLLPDGERFVEWHQPTDARGLKKLMRRLKKEAEGELRVCYEAGPCGYALQRELHAAEIACIVVAPSLVPRKPGERVKTNRRDARHLAKSYRAGTLTEVAPPTPEEESARDLCRCREDARADLLRCRHRLGKMLLRRGLVYPRKAWTQAHRRWLRSLRLEHETAQVVFDDYVRAIEHTEQRLTDLAERIEVLSRQAPYREPVGWLRCYRGIDTVTAMGIVTELHGFPRFRSARALMAYLGLVPSEHSTGEHHRRGAITKAGNSHLRRLLIEAAQHYRHKPGVGVKLRQRRVGQPGWVIALADRAQVRLHKRYWRLVLQSKPHNKVVTAIARELVGFIWATLAQQGVDASEVVAA